MNATPPLSLYCHIPFCRSRCSYCDFNAYAGMDDLIVRYARALAREIRLVGRAAQASPEIETPVIHTLFFGGGTPSLTPLEGLKPILEACRDSFEFTADAEITLEANPGTVSQAYLDGLRRLGINRLSFGVQSAHAAELALFNRVHSFDEAVEAVTQARAAGFENLNLDLIYGIPGQTLAMWQETFERTLALEPDHLSAYALSLEFGTPMHAWVERGLLATPDSDRAADMYDWASEALAGLGYEQYEVSNWARRCKEEGRGKKEDSSAIESEELLPASSLLSPKNACHHNLQYWRNLPYLGFGAGAHGSAGGWRYSDVLSPRGYVERIENGPETLLDGYPFSAALAEKHVVDRQAEMGETMMLGMRLLGEGVREDTFRERFGIGLGEQYAKELTKLKTLGLIEWDQAGARLTHGARLLGNRVFREFV